MGGTLTLSPGQQKVERLGVEHDAAVFFAVDEIPIVADLVRSDSGHVERQGVGLGPVADGIAVSGPQIQAQKEAVGGRELLVRVAGRPPI